MAGISATWQLCFRGLHMLVEVVETAKTPLALLTEVAPLVVPVFVQQVALPVVPGGLGIPAYGTDVAATT